MIAHLGWLQKAEEFRVQIQGVIDSVSMAVSELDDEDQAIDVQQSKFLGDVQTVEAAIQLQTTELKQMIDRQSDRLLREVKIARQQREQEVDRRKNDVKRNQLVLQDFQKYSEEVKDKGTVDIKLLPQV